MKSTTLIVIPARFPSTRFPGKPLKDETGWPLIRHTYEQAKKSVLASDVYVATDDKRIFDVVESFGGKAVMTRDDHPSGTDRIKEAMEKIGGNYDIIINVQGDEPEIEPEYIDQLIELHQKSGAFVSTMACPFPDGKPEGHGSPLDTACVKAVLGAQIEGIKNAYRAVYFSRSLCPYPRASGGKVINSKDFYMHLGMYAYSPTSLVQYVGYPQGVLEKTESLEQLRILENGQTIAVGVIPKATPGIDTPDDYAAFVARWKAHHE